MTNTLLLKQIRDVNWVNFAQPEWNKPGDVEHAFELVLAASDAASSDNAYNRIMFSIGNSHGGTYYPVIIPALPFMEEVLKIGQPWAKSTVVSALLDLYGSFEPEFERIDYHTSDEFRSQLLEMVQNTIANFRGTLESLAASDEIAAKDARELLQEISEKQT